MTAWLKDTLERVGATFVETVAGSYALAAVTDYNIDFAKAAALGGVTAAASALKAAVAKRYGSRNTASLVS